MIVSQPLTLHEAQGIAEGIVGSVQWRGAEAWCECPGKASHTNANAPTDCKVIAEKIGTLAPGIYCHHDSCRAEVDAASFAVRSALGKRTPSGSRPRPVFIIPTRPPAPTFQPDKLERIARKLDGADAEWFAVRSAKSVHNRTPASFLHELYADGEKVVVFDDFQSQGQALWTHSGPTFDATALDSFRKGKPHGVWFLSNPVTGEFVENRKNDDGTPHYSRRSWQTVTSWRYLVLESDKANPAHWLAVLAQMPLRIAAIYSSGGKSIHALVRLDAESKAHWDAIADELKPVLVTLGADRKAMSAVRLTRLPQCERVEKLAVQTLLYLNASPTECPIADLATGGAN